MYWKWLFYTFSLNGGLKCLLLYFELCVRAYSIRVCVTVDGSYMEAITGSEGPQTPTVPLTLGQTECISLPLSLSASPFLSFSLCLFFTTSLFLYLSLFLSLSGLNYFRMSPNKGARWNPFSFFFYWEQKPWPYFNSHHTFPICANKPWK